MTGLILMLVALLVGGSANSEATAVESVVGGIPQQRLVLGDPEAPVEVVEYGDLQCPFCRDWAENKLPRLIRGPVAAGKVKLRFANFDVIDSKSIVASTAALAAGEQGRGWQFLEAFFHRQGAEGSGYVTAGFLTRIAEAAGVEDIDRWRQERKSARLRREATESTRRAFKLGFTGTPSFSVRGPATHGTAPLGTPSGVAELLKAIDEAAGHGAGGQLVGGRPLKPTGVRA